MEKDTTEVVELYELSYSDLILLSQSDPNNTLRQRLEEARARILETLGPMGPGLLSITCLPSAAASLRHHLLPLARRLALLDHQRRSRILKEYKLGSDVPLKNPDRNVSSFAMLLNYAAEFSNANTNLVNINEEDNEFGNLGHAFKELGYFMMELGLSLARICDHAIGGDELEQSLLESGTAKCRLIHYHSTVDASVLRAMAGKKVPPCKGMEQCGETKRSGVNKQSKLWQQWHYDYSSFTVLTAPMFFSYDQECLNQNERSHLQIFDTKKNKVLTVKASPDSFIIQVGESADVLSKGKLRSTLHCVSRPLEFENVSRETYVVFLQPAWSKTLSLAGYSTEPAGLQHEIKEFASGIDKIVPPLASRLRDGMTFAEFARETTMQYYGGSGLQSNR